MSENVHIGHRSRMRRKFRDYGDRFFDDYELLEMFLYFVVPVRDTNPLAKALLARFGGIGGVLRASREELLEVSGVGERVAELIISASRLMGHNPSVPESSGICFEDYNTAGQYFASSLEGKEDCAVYMASFDNRMNLLGFDMIYELEYSSGGVKPGAFIDVAVNRRASAAIIVHNHPNGPLFPTEGDRQTNMVVSAALESTNVCLLEHYVISGNGYIGFMNSVRVPFAQRSAAIESFLASKKKFTPS